MAFQLDLGKVAEGRPLPPDVPTQVIPQILSPTPTPTATITAIQQGSQKLKEENLNWYMKNVVPRIPAEFRTEEQQRFFNRYIATPTVTPTTSIVPR